MGKLAIFAAAFAMTATAAAAQTAPQPQQPHGQQPLSQQPQVTPAGQWRCAISMQPHRQDPIKTHYWEFDMYVAPNGQWQVQGVYFSPSIGQVSLQGAGATQLQPGKGGLPIAVFQGAFMRGDGLQTPHAMALQMADQRNMYYQSRDNTHTYAYQCQR